MKRCSKIILGLLAIIIIGYGVFAVSVRPSNARDWSEDLSVLATSEFNDNLVTIKNIRNFKYDSVLEYTPDYYDKTFDLNEIKSVDFIVEPFSGVAAHTFVAFGFEDGSYVDISIEVRREKGEFYNIFKGMVRRFELVYVVADENDVLKLRTNHRKDDVYIYPIDTTKEKMRKMFVSMLSRANKLAKEPEFYNTVTNNCTTNIVEHVNEISTKRVPLSYKYFLPKYSDELAYEIGLIKGEGTIEELRESHNVKEVANLYGDDPDFSHKIREILPE
ncbi:MAG: hypothetical protein COV70_02560 [Parcubacteria group bacterium CG11_big_fil_rev_8_21_14_0_20_39_22]|nr:MAG: hypothetical protein COV70_02560 [Parcubacteria group bacterium CG11_big_fil_rev_8_21_14_0_20_39_22]